MIGFNEGLGPQLLEGLGSISGSSTPFAFEIYTTPLLELTQAYTDIEIVPAKPGYFPVLCLPASVANIIIESVVGVQTSPPVYRAGSDPSRLNFMTETTTPSNANVNAAAALGLPGASGGPINPASQLSSKRFPGLPIYFSLVTPAVGTGGYSCKAKIVIPVIWLPSGDA